MQENLMKNSFWLESIVTVSCFGLTAIAVCARTTVSTPDKVPDRLKVPANQSLVLKTSAKGFQIYVCKAKADNPRQFEWSLKAPEAQLFGDGGEKLGSHYMGPTWESKDKSKVIGQIKAKVNAPDKSAIPWLLLTAKSHAGNGIFSRVNWVQRVNTIGGQATAQGCDRDRQNREIRVSYSADYYFYGNY
jgi:hypothetical protein